MVRVLEDVTYAARQLLPSGAAAQVPSQDARRAAPRRNDPGEDLRQGGLPTAVGPEQRHEVAALQGEMRAAQGGGGVSPGGGVAPPRRGVATRSRPGVSTGIGRLENPGGMASAAWATVSGRDWPGATPSPAAMRVASRACTPRSSSRSRRL